MPGAQFTSLTLVLVLQYNSTNCDGVLHARAPAPRGRRRGRRQDAAARTRRKPTRNRAGSALLRRIFWGTSAIRRLRHSLNLLALLSAYSYKSTNTDLHPLHVAAGHGEPGRRWRGCRRGAAVCWTLASAPEVQAPRRVSGWDSANACENACVHRYYHALMQQCRLRGERERR